MKVNHSIYRHLLTFVVEYIGVVYFTYMIKMKLYL